MKKLSDWVKEVKLQKVNKQIQSETEKASDENNNEDKTTISPTIKDNLDKVRNDLGGSQDVIIREFAIGEEGYQKVAILYTDGLADSTIVQEFVLKTLMINLREAHLKGKNIKHTTLETLEKYCITGGEMKKVSDMKTVEHDILSGDTVIIIDGETEAFTIGTKGWEHRGIEEPTSQTVVRGPKEGFNEMLRSSTALIRRKIKSPNLWVEQMVIGRETQTDIAIIYINGIVNPSIVDEVKARLKKIDVDGILESGYLEEFIQDETYTPFPTIYNTERPDVVAANLLEGRVAIVVDGTPFVLIVPALFVQFLQASEDYYSRADIAIALRFLRYFAFILALLVPSAYIAVTTFHQEMLPTTLLISLAAQREGVPFPAVVEALIMEITFEILREAGIRMPRAIGSAISIVGALVLGQAAVQAGIVSAVMVIIVSITAISSFVIPEYNLAISVRLLRFLFMIASSMLGLFGILLGLIVLVTHLTSLRSFGIPYLSPFAPLNKDGQKDALLRLPHWALFSRPRLIAQKNYIRNRTKAPKPKQQEGNTKNGSEAGGESDA